jgi:hypothetical protein
MHGPIVWNKRTEVQPVEYGRINAAGEVLALWDPGHDWNDAAVEVANM